MGKSVKVFFATLMVSTALLDNHFRSVYFPLCFFILIIVKSFSC